MALSFPKRTLFLRVIFLSVIFKSNAYVRRLWQSNIYSRVKHFFWNFGVLKGCVTNFQMQWLYPFLLSIYEVIYYGKHYEVPLSLKLPVSLSRIENTVLMPISCSWFSQFDLIFERQLVHVVMWLRGRWVYTKLLARNFINNRASLLSHIRSSFKFLDSNWLFICRLKINSWPCLCRLDIYLKYSNRDFFL